MSSIPRPNSVSSLPSTSGTTTENDRRRRDNLNDKIQQLLDKIPEDYFQDYYRRKDVIDMDDAQMTPGSNGLGSAGSVSAKLKGTGTKDGKPNKGQILTQAVEYITKLQGHVDARNREEVELILRVKELSKQMEAPVNDINLENTSAEVALAKIGVGPLASVADEYFENADLRIGFEGPNLDNGS
ncbi:LANO_0A04368g1_1 [Lachancea nothofagi CBS 11611]|uniref:LANO_0A04368g1_1 n=1 Tax=Lachancea nothofagi CBS 11611 TaxID=1266666 RepID=A0A1G4IQV3_9SACH|nr:LANO_0A04368g1_1 [Lachancea nothofagi CBS 11611]